MYLGIIHFFSNWEPQKSFTGKSLERPCNWIHDLRSEPSKPTLVSKNERFCKISGTTLHRCVWTRHQNAWKPAVSKAFPYSGLYIVYPLHCVRVSLLRIVSRNINISPRLNKVAMDASRTRRAAQLLVLLDELLLRVPHSVQNECHKLYIRIPCS